MCTLWGPNAACDLPTFIVFPITQEGLIECGGVAILRMLDAKEMTVVPN